MKFDKIKRLHLVINLQLFDKADVALGQNHSGSILA
jgi:hypothetical protein